MLNLFKKREKDSTLFIPGIEYKPIQKDSSLIPSLNNVLNDIIINKIKQSNGTNLEVRIPDIISPSKSGKNKETEMQKIIDDLEEKLETASKDLESILKKSENRDPEIQMKLIHITKEANFEKIEGYTLVDVDSIYNFENKFYYSTGKFLRNDLVEYKKEKIESYYADNILIHTETNEKPIRRDFEWKNHQRGSTKMIVDNMKW